MLLQEFQQQQLAAAQAQLADARAALDAATAAGNASRDALLAVHTALSPSSLAAALTCGGELQAAGKLSMRPEEHEALTSRLLCSKAVAAADGEAVAARVRELLLLVRSSWLATGRAAAPAALLLLLLHCGQAHANELTTMLLCACCCCRKQVRQTSLSWERAGAAARTDADAASEQLQQQLQAATAAQQQLRQQLEQQQQESQAQAQACGEALAAAGAEVHQLTAALQDAKQLQQVRCKGPAAADGCSCMHALLACAPPAYALLAD